MRYRQNPSIRGNYPPIGVRPSTLHAILLFVVCVSVAYTLFPAKPNNNVDNEQQTYYQAIQNALQLQKQTNDKGSTSPPGSLFDPIQINSQCSPFQKRRRVIDMIFVNFELSSLELRLNELWNVVDVFLIAESTIPWKPDGKPKPTYLTNHWMDFAKFHSKMKLVVIPPEVSQGTGARVDLNDWKPNFNTQSAQRYALWTHMKSMLTSPEDLVIFGDFDEIPRPDIIEKLACQKEINDNVFPICLETKDSFYYYNFKCHIKFEWKGSPRILHNKHGLSAMPETACKSRIVNGSTHCSSCFGTMEEYISKSVSNSEPIRNPLQTNNASIIERVQSCKDFWMREHLDKEMELRESVDHGGIPMIVSKHPERWTHMLGEGPLYASAHSPIETDESGKTNPIKVGSNVLPTCSTAQNICVQPYYPTPKTITCPVVDELKNSETGAYILPKNFVYRFDQSFAKAILNILNNNATSDGSTVLELGAGLGCYTHYFNASGKLSRIAGYEGAANVNELTNGFIKHADLTEEHDFGQFDWVISLEVAEHIPSEFEAIFVANLLKPSPKGIVLSWALPDQPGSGHVNGKTNEYVISLLKTKGYEFNSEKTQVLRSQAELGWFKGTTMVFLKSP